MKTVAVATLMSISLSSFANYPCKSHKGNSCWFAKNDSTQSASVSCFDLYNSRFEANLDPNEAHSHQFNRGWGDGLGYPEPGVLSECTVTYQNNKVIYFKFKSIDWGNRVEMSIMDKKVDLTLTKIWEINSSETYTFY